MNMHKRIKLTPLDRQEIWRQWQSGNVKVAALARKYRVSQSWTDMMANTFTCATPVRLHLLNYFAPEYGDSTLIVETRESPFKN